MAIFSPRLFISIRREVVTLRWLSVVFVDISVYLFVVGFELRRKGRQFVNDRRPFCFSGKLVPHSSVFIRLVILVFLCVFSCHVKEC